MNIIYVGHCQRYHPVTCTEESNYHVSAGSHALSAFPSVHKDHLSCRSLRSATIIHVTYRCFRKCQSPAKTISSMVMFLGDVADNRRWVSEIYLQSLDSGSSECGRSDKASPRTPPTKCMASIMLLEYRQCPNFKLPTSNKDAKRARAEAVFLGGVN